MSITILDPAQRIPVPRLDRDGRLTSSALTTWLREYSDWSQRTATSDWRRAAEHYRAQLQAELRERVDRKLVNAVRRTRSARVTTEVALEEARQATEDLDLPAGVPRSTAGAREHRARRQAVTDAEQAMITARTAERDALSALSQRVMPFFCEQHDRAGFLVQEASRAAKALIDDARRAARVVEAIDPTELLLSEGEAHDNQH